MSSAGMMRVPNVGNKVLLSATGNAVGVATMQEARGFRNWSFQLDQAGSPVGTWVIEGTIDSNTSGVGPNYVTSANNWFAIGSSTDPAGIITYDKPLNAVRASVTGFASGVFTILGTAVP